MQQCFAAIIFCGSVLPVIGSRRGSRNTRDPLQTEEVEQTDGDLGHVFEKWPGFTLDWKGERLSCRYPASANCDARQVVKDPDFKNYESFFNVYPGGDTECIKGEEYYFTVHVGDPDKLHIHFQGGGACWGKKAGENENTSGDLLSGCRTKINNQAPRGFMNLDDDRNPWRNYSFVVINYCSGDVHMGHATHRWGSRPASLEQADVATERGQTWDLPPRGETKQRGFNNAMSALQYAKLNFGDAKHVTVSGSSAGSIGTVAWTRWIVENFQGSNKELTIIGDSFIGIMMPLSEAYRLENIVWSMWGACNEVLLSEDNYLKCKAAQISTTDLRGWNLRNYPKVRMATLNGKEDAVQIGYEIAGSINFDNPRGIALTPGKFYKQASLDVQEYLQHANYYNFWVHSPMHVYLTLDATLFTTRTNVLLGPGEVWGTGLSDWLQDLIDHKTAPKTRDECFGPKIRLTPRTIIGPANIRWCSK